MKFIVLLFATQILFQTGFSQNYPVGKRTINFIDATRSNRAVSTDVYYPGASAGTNVAVTPGTEKFPVVVFGHGFVIPTTAYTWLADSLVKYGFIVAFPSTETSFSPSHDQFGRDIAFLCQRITSLNDSSSSFLSARVMNKSAAAGHSMGGGCSFLAPNYYSGITALFNFAAAETNPSAKQAALLLQRPAIIFSGSSDCIAAPSEQMQMYTNIPYPCKTYINITNALHCQFANNDVTCVLGQITTGCNSSSITAAVVFQKSMSLLLPFLNYYLKSNCSAQAVFDNAYNSIAGVVKQRTCIADPQGCLVTGVGNTNNDRNIRIFPLPAPAGGSVYIVSDLDLIRSVTIYNEAGQTIRSVESANTKKLELTGLPAGTYRVMISVSKKILYRKLIIL